ncbi:MAG: hypothetical protein AB8G05_24415 [Oligoflexales bacterium]
MPAKTLEASECLGNTTIINEQLYHQNPSDQGSLGICYAHSVANIYASVYQQNYGEFIFPSPLMLSIYSGMKGYKSSPFKSAPLHKKIYYLAPIVGWKTYLFDKYYSKKKGIVERVTGGLFNEAFADAVSTSPCSIESIEWFLDIQNGSLPTKKSLKLFYEYIKYLKEIRSNLIQQEDLCSNLLEHYMQEKGFVLNYEILEKFTAIKNYIEQYGFVNSQVTGKTYIKRTFANFLLQRCKEFNSGREFGRFKYKIDSYYSLLYGHKNLIGKLEQHFTHSKSLPVELGYCYGYLTDREECGYHSSVIYGKTCFQNKTYFLVRNSWGGKSLRESFFEPGSDHSRKGDYWISTNELKKSWTRGLGELNFVRNLGPKIGSS